MARNNRRQSGQKSKTKSTEHKLNQEEKTPLGKRSVKEVSPKGTKSTDVPSAKKTKMDEVSAKSTKGKDNSKEQINPSEVNEQRNSTDKFSEQSSGIESQSLNNNTTVTVQAESRSLLASAKKLAQIEKGKNKKSDESIVLRVNEQEEMEFAEEEQTTLGKTQNRKSVPADLGCSQDMMMKIMRELESVKEQLKSKDNSSQKIKEPTEINRVNSVPMNFIEE